MRHSSTKGKHITLTEPALPKGQACVCCKTRKVRCDAVKPACGSCRRTARFEGRDESEVVCAYLPGRKCGTRRRRKASTEAEVITPPPEPTEAVPFTLPELPPLDGQYEHYPSAALLLMNHNHLARTDTNSSDWSDFSARSGEVGSSSASTANTTPSPTSPKAFEPLDAHDSNFSTLSFPFAPIPAPSTLPLPPHPPLDSTSYFDALNYARSTTTSYAAPTVEPQAPLPTQYPSFNPFSFFALPPPPSTTGYFDLPPPPLVDQQQQGWSDVAQTSALDFDWSMGAMSGVPFTPGVLDWEALASATA